MADEEFAVATRQAALSLQRLCQYAGCSTAQPARASTSTPGLSSSILSAVKDSAALAILMTYAAAWLQGVVLERKRMADAGEEGAKLMLVLDEAGGSPLTSASRNGCRAHSS